MSNTFRVSAGVNPKDIRNARKSSVNRRRTRRNLRLVQPVINATNEDKAEDILSGVLMNGWNK